MIKIEKFTFNPFYENTYILWDKVTKEAMIVDPGCSDDFEEKTIESFVAEKKLKVKYLINTHCHIDHILGNAFIKETYNPRFLAPEEDIFLIENAVEQGKMFGLKVKKSPKPDELLSEKLDIQLGNIIGRLLYTPGHSPGEYCILFEEDKLCISGDVLFYESIGRTDLWKGDYETLINSIRTKLFVLPDDTKVYPGHGETTTIGYEKKNNPFLQENL